MGFGCVRPQCGLLDNLESLDLGVEALGSGQGLWYEYESEVLGYGHCGAFGRWLLGLRA